MKIKTVHTTEADRESARVFFGALLGMYVVTGPTLDMFARNGELTVSAYKAHVYGPVDLWELDPAHAPALRAFSPRVLFTGCSYGAMILTPNKYEMIVVDTPQGIHTDYSSSGQHRCFRRHAEHFYVMKNIGPLLEDHAIIVLYCNRTPYNRDTEGSHGYDEYVEYDFDEWMAAREDFYGGDPQNTPEEAMLMAYRKVLSAQGFRVRGVTLPPAIRTLHRKNPMLSGLGWNVLGRPHDDFHSTPDDGQCRHCFSAPTVNRRPGCDGGGSKVGSAVH